MENAHHELYRRALYQLRQRGREQTRIHENSQGNSPARPTLRRISSPWLSRCSKKSWTSSGSLPSCSLKRVPLRLQTQSTKNCSTRSWPSTTSLLSRNWWWSVTQSSTTKPWTSRRVPKKTATKRDQWQTKSWLSGKQKWKAQPLQHHWQKPRKQSHLVQLLKSYSTPRLLLLRL